MKVTPEPKKESIAPTKVTAMDAVLDTLVKALDERDTEEDDTTAGYNWAQQISNQISKAQSGHGPYRMRYLKIAELAIAAILSGDRNLEKQS